LKWLSSEEAWKQTFQKRRARIGELNTFGRWVQNQKITSNTNPEDLPFNRRKKTSTRGGEKRPISRARIKNHKKQTSKKFGKEDDPASYSSPCQIIQGGGRNQKKKVCPEHSPVRGILKKKRVHWERVREHAIKRNDRWSLNGGRSHTEVEEARQKVAQDLGLQFPDKNRGVRV